MNFLGNSTLKSKYKSVLNVRERSYCNRLKTLQGCTTFPTREQDQRPYPRPRISVDSCLNLSHKHNRLWANGREGQVHRKRRSHSITTRTESDQGKVWLMLIGLPSHYKVCGLYGKVLKAITHRSLINLSKTNHVSSIPTWPYHTCPSPNHLSYLLNFYPFLTNHVN